MLGFFGSQTYPEGQIPPEPGIGLNWNVRCMTGALEVLATEEYVEWLKSHPGKEYGVNFANFSAAHIHPGHPLWQALAKIAQTYDVSVYPLDFRNTYLPWTGAPDNLRHFDAFIIKTKMPTDEKVQS